MQVTKEALAANLALVRAAIIAAAVRAGRKPEDVRLLAVTKTVDAAAAAALFSLGATDLGENRPIEGAAKAAATAAALSGAGAPAWHLIGHLQRNKVRKTIPVFRVIHSVDSARLLEELEAEAGRQGIRLTVFAEINVSGEERKTGMKAEEAEGFCRRASEMKNIDLSGLMTMAPYSDNPENARPVFRGLRALRDELNAKSVHSKPLKELSMGMSGDFEVAIEEGATWVRIGTRLFE
jgi:PLP dependent protein